ncbi:hypothetical protein C8R44DRAFT_731192 [Mycena epipterygia]|nr:hypothetical protein C8R44DRAFT_731192 [Mycena epipterygia]
MLSTCATRQSEIQRFGVNPGYDDDDQEVASPRALCGKGWYAWIQRTKNVRQYIKENKPTHLDAKKKLSPHRSRIRMPVDGPISSPSYHPLRVILMETDVDGPAYFVHERRKDQGVEPRGGLQRSSLGVHRAKICCARALSAHGRELEPGWTLSESIYASFLSLAQLSLNNLNYLEKYHPKNILASIQESEACSWVKTGKYTSDIANSHKSSLDSSDGFRSPRNFPFPHAKNHLRNPARRHLVIKLWPHDLAYMRRMAVGKESWREICIGWFWMVYNTIYMAYEEQGQGHARTPGAFDGLAEVTFVGKLWPRLHVAAKHQYGGEELFVKDFRVVQDLDVVVVGSGRLISIIPLLSRSATIVSLTEAVVIPRYNVRKGVPISVNEANEGPKLHPENAKSEDAGSEETSKRANNVDVMLACWWCQLWDHISIIFLDKFKDADLLKNHIKRQPRVRLEASSL